jgi:hypothetical protein
MTDQEILQQLQKQLENDVTAEQIVKDFYIGLVTKFFPKAEFIHGNVPLLLSRNYRHCPIVGLTNFYRTEIQRPQLQPN